MTNFVVFITKEQVNDMLRRILKEIASENFLLERGFEKRGKRSPIISIGDSVSIILESPSNEEDMNSILYHYNTSENVGYYINLLDDPTLTKLIKKLRHYEELNTLDVYMIMNAVSEYKWSKITNISNWKSSREYAYRYEITNDVFFEIQILYHKITGVHEPNDPATLYRCRTFKNGDKIYFERSKIYKGLLSNCLFKAKKTAIESYTNY